jgi:amino acid permease
MQKGFEQQKRSSNLAFKRWAICVASIYGLLMCLVVGISAHLAVSAQPNTPTLTGYSSRVSEVPPVTTRHDL